MLENLLIAAVLMAITTIIHTGAMLIVLKPILHPFFIKQRVPLKVLHVLQVWRVLLLMFFATTLEVVVWAYAYLSLGAIELLEDAVYFSMVTFTTVGYGDIVLHESWRLLSAFEAANGIIMFGWTTAIVIGVVTRIYFTEIGKGPDA
jgi:hypothetical protein